jgi:hypothetical protein
MDSLFKPNWRQINKLIQEGQAHVAWKEIDAIRKKVRERVDAKYQDDKVKKEIMHVTALKELPRCSTVYYTGSDQRILGLAGTKMEDKRTKMIIDFGDKKVFLVQYTQLSTEPLKESEIILRKMANKIFK